MNIQTIAIDMDGTLLDSKGVVSKELIHLINDLRKRGIHVFLATGRTLKEVYEVLPETVQVDGIVSANGMACYINNQKVTTHELDSTLVNEVIHEARARHFYYEIHDNNGIRYASDKDKHSFISELKKNKAKTLLENEFIARMDSVENRITWVHDLPSENIIKLYFFSMDKQHMDTWKRRLNKIQQDINFSTFSSSLHNVEIMTHNISKATGIQVLLDEYGLSTDTLMTIGDSENDLPMFLISAYSVAMKNADALIQQKSDIVTKLSHDENGLYQFLYTYFQDVYNDI